MRGLHLLPALALGLTLSAPAHAQDADTLADIRQDLSLLSVEMQRLRRELSTTGGSGLSISGGTLDRVNAIEAELQRLTGQTEQMQNRIDSVVSDGTNRIGDLQFRLCEIEPGCDIGALGDTPPLGGTAPQTAGQTPPTPPPAPGGETGTTPGSGAEPLPLSNPETELAVSEETDFRRAQEALASGDFQSAEDLFATFRTTYPGGPLDGAALVGHGRALNGLGQPREAARLFLDSFNLYPEGPVADEALFRLGAALGDLGSTSEACVALSEVSSRYPASSFTGDAQAELASLGCS